MSSAQEYMLILTALAGLQGFMVMLWHAIDLVMPNEGEAPVEPWEPISMGVLRVTEERYRLEYLACSIRLDEEYEHHKGYKEHCMDTLSLQLAKQLMQFSEVREIDEPHDYHKHLELSVYVGVRK